MSSSSTPRAIVTFEIKWELIHYVGFDTIKIFDTGERSVIEK